jgi:hypothetical protein
VAQSGEQFRKQHGDQSVVLDHEDPECFHRCRCARPRLARKQSNQDRTTAL